MRVRSLRVHGWITVHVCDFPVANAVVAHIIEMAPPVIYSAGARRRDGNSVGEVRDIPVESVTNVDACVRQLLSTKKLQARKV